MRNKHLLMMIEASFFATFALILDLLPSIRLSANISISIAMVPIFIIAFRWGVKGGMLSGFMWGLLQVIMADAYILTPLQGLIEYFVAFAFIGMAGLFAERIQKNVGKDKKRWIGWSLMAVVIGSFARYFWHFIAGFIYWGEYAPKGMSPILFSLAVNGGTMLGATVLCSLIIILLLNTAPRFLLRGLVTHPSIEKKIS